MRENSSIKLEIPVPWAVKPASIEAKGRNAVLVAGIVAAIIIAVIALR